MSKPKFDPSKPFQVSQEAKPKFDPSAPYEAPSDVGTAQDDSPKTSVAEAGLQGYGQGFSLGHLPHLQAMAEPISDRVYDGLADIVGAPKAAEYAPWSQMLPWTDEYVKARDRNIKEDETSKNEHPWAHGIGTVAGSVGLGLATAGMGGAGEAATVGQKIDNAARIGATMGGLQNPGDVEGKINIGLEDRLAPAAIGGALGGVIQGGAEALGAAGKKGADFVEQLSPKLKENADEIRAAAKRLGIEPTEGMTHDSHAIQGLESSLEQSPSFAGASMRAKTGPVRDAMRSGAEDLVDDATSLSPYEVGERVKKGITGNVAEKRAGPAMLFDELHDQAENYPLNPKSLSRVTRNMENLPQVKLAPGSPWANKAAQYAEWFRNAQNPNDIKVIRTLLGKELSQAEGPEALGLSAMYKKASHLEENSVMRGAVEASRNQHGERIGKDAVTNLREAKRGYKALMDDISDLAQNAKLGKGRTVDDFLNRLEGVKSESLPQKLFNTDDLRLLQTVQKQHPQEFELLRQSKLSDLMNGSRGPDGKLVPTKLLQNIKSMSDEAGSMLFGGSDKFSKAKDLRTLAEAWPRKMGPSGTPEGNSFIHSVNPMFQANEAMRYQAYKAASSPQARQALIDKLMTFPRIAAAAAKNPTSFNSFVSNLLQSPGFNPKALQQDTPAPSNAPNIYMGNQNQRETK